MRHRGHVAATLSLKGRGCKHPLRHAFGVTPPPPETGEDAFITGLRLELASAIFGWWVGDGRHQGNEAHILKSWGFEIATGRRTRTRWSTWILSTSERMRSATRI